MSSVAVVRSRLTRASKPILKRPARPAPLAIARSPRSPRSSRVHFPPSPALFATFSTHSPSTYDRGPYPVSPSSISLLSPSLPGAFKLADPPKRKIATRASAPVLEANDPRSPRPAGSLTFGAAAAALSRGSEPRAELNTALKGYPRSPYPSAPLSPEVPPRETPRARSNSSDGVRTLAPRRPPPLVIANSHGKQNTVATATGTGTGTITFQLTSSRRLAPPHLDLSAARMPPFLTPVRESASSAGVEVELDVDKPIPESCSDASSGGDSTRLSNAFWRSVSFQTEPGLEGPLASLALITGNDASASEGGFPESVTGSDPDLGGLTLLMSPRPRVPQFGHTSQGARVPSLLFGRSDGSVWSPGPFSSASPNPSGLISPAPWPTGGLTSPRPGARMNSNLAVPRRVIAAPSPNDPFAKFPSFAAALQMDVPKAPTLNIMPPPRAHLPCEY